MSGMTHELHTVKSKKTLKYFLLELKCLVCEASHLPPSVAKLKSAWSITSAVPRVFGCDSQHVTEKTRDLMIKIQANLCLDLICICFVC